ncbi:unnamed protein product [Echinostoma caproni]|uniref:TUG-UBL1 domain-containing protein n=1 Tax=Echinostoma caproni TaxID=27848 RepID=A0A183AK53_9TREM|nr:unnamed protein product [Echinostoma caproni]
MDQLGLYPCSRRDPLTFEDLLQKLPECTVGKSGRIIRIREDLRDSFAPASQPVTMKQVDFTNSLEHKTENEQSIRLEFVALRIRSENGSSIYNLRMSMTDTIGQLYACLNAVRDGILPYKLVTVGQRRPGSAETELNLNSTNVCYRRALTDMNQTLEQAGLQGRTLLRMERSQDAKFSLCPAYAMNNTMWTPSRSFVPENSTGSNQQ